MDETFSMISLERQLAFVEFFEIPAISLKREERDEEDRRNQRKRENWKSIEEDDGNFLSCMLEEIRATESSLTRV